MVDKRPWEIHPALEPRRMNWLAKRIVEIASDVARARLPVKGETSWALGCRRYEWVRHRLYEDSKQIPWLTAVPLNDHGFDLKVGGVPIQYFHGDPDKPRNRHLLRGLEKSQGELFPPQAGDLPGEVWAYYLVLQTDEHGNGLDVVFFESSSRGRQRNSVSLPMKPATAVVSRLDSARKDATRVPSPGVRVKAPAAKKSHGDDTAGG